MKPTTTAGSSLSENLLASALRAAGCSDPQIEQVIVACNGASARAAANVERAIAIRQSIRNMIQTPDPDKISSAPRHQQVGLVRQRFEVENERRKRRGEKAVAIPHDQTIRKEIDAWLADIP